MVILYLLIPVNIHLHAEQYESLRLIALSVQHWQTNAFQAVKQYNHG
jgi:hypothetical protein